MPSGPGDHKDTSRAIKTCVEYTNPTLFMPLPMSTSQRGPFCVLCTVVVAMYCLQTSIFATAIRPLTWGMLSIIDPLLSMCFAKPLCRVSPHNKQYYGQSSSVALVFRVLFERIQAPIHPVSDITATVRSLQVPLS